MFQQKKKCVKGKLRKGQRLKEKYHQNAPKDSDRIKGSKRKAIHDIIISSVYIIHVDISGYNKPRHHGIHKWYLRCVPMGPFKVMPNSNGGRKVFSIMLSFHEYLCETGDNVNTGSVVIQPATLPTQTGPTITTAFCFATPPHPSTHSMACNRILSG